MSKGSKSSKHPYKAIPVKVVEEGGGRGEKDYDDYPLTSILFCCETFETLSQSGTISVCPPMVAVGKMYKGISIPPLDGTAAITFMDLARPMKTNTQNRDIGILCSIIKPVRLVDV